MSPLAPRGAADTPVCSILDIPGPRWFRKDDPIWRVHSDAATPIGITTALFMLAANPSYAAVLTSCDADKHPWHADDYLHDLVEITTFGTVDDAVVTIDNAFRDRSSFSGRTEHGDYFYGSDPESVEWAQAATAWALLTAFQRFAEHPLTSAESDLYVRQWKGVAILQGARSFPTSARELEQLLRSARGRVRATETGRRVARRLRETALECPGVTENSVIAHRSCTTVVDAAASLVPSDVRRALDLSHRPMDRSAVFGRITRAHERLSSTELTTRAPIAAPSAMRTQTV